MKNIGEQGGGGVYERGGLNKGLMVFRRLTISTIFCSLSLDTF